MVVCVMSKILEVVLENLTFFNSLVAFILGWYIYHWLHRRLLNSPPGPIGFPLLGSIPFLKLKAEETFATWTKIYGPVMSVQLGPVRTVVLNSIESIEEAFQQNGPAFSGRYVTYFTRMTTHNKGLIFLNEVDNWTIQRRFGSRALFGTNIHGKRMETRILEEAELLCEVIRQKKGKPFVLESDLLLAVANVISQLAMNERCTENEELSRFAKLVVDGFRDDSLAYTLLSIFPWSRFLPFLQKNVENIKSGISFGNGLMDKLIDQHMKHLDRKEARDLIDAYLIQHEGNNFSFEDLEQLRFYLKDLFAAGTETTTSTIRWIIFYLIRYPEVQRKVHLEIERELSAEGQVKLHLDLPYTRAVIQEGFRIRTITPLSVPRRSTRDITLMGYHIPKDTQILANLYAVHMNPVHWPEPEKFMPERHLDEEGRFVRSNRIIPFSIGARNCLGENLARAEVFLVIVMLLQKFEILPNPDNPNPPEYGVPGIVCSAPHYPLIMKEK